MAFIIKTKHGYVGRYIIENVDRSHRSWGLVPTGSPFSYWSGTTIKANAARFETPEAAAEICVLLNAGDVRDEVSMLPVLFRPSIANLLEDRP